MWHTISKEEVLNKLRSNAETGLSDSEVKKKQEEVGLNKLNEPKRESLLIRFIKQFNDFMIIILIFAAIVSAVISVVEHNSDYIDSIIIVFIVVFNAVLGLVQESKAEKSLEALKKMNSPTAKVKRNGSVSIIPTEEVVPGDILVLEAGQYVPADCRLISSHSLRIEEAALTGENVPVSKNANIVLAEDIATGDMLNMCFSTTIVVAGSADAVVTETGMNTKVGKIAGMIINDENPETPIQKKLKQVGKVLGTTALCICILIFIIGTIKKIPVYEMFMTSVGLAVAAIPEGLPAIITIMLAIGVTRMAKRNAIIRKLPAVETLGSSSVICSDKTGTLTQNKMTVIEAALKSGSGYQMSDAGKWDNIKKKEIEFLLELGTMCNDSHIGNEKLDNGELKIDGDPTETAIVSAALKLNVNKNELYKNMPRVNELPFDSERKLMTTVHSVNGKYRVITKGAPDILLGRCNKIWQDGQIDDIQLSKNTISGYNIEMANKALRVIGVAYVDLDTVPNEIDTNNIENNLIFVGLIGMIDPPREGVAEAVATCKKAGIKPVMITGDHLNTAVAIAKELGIYKEGERAVSGMELDDISQEALEKDIFKYSVFARVSPEHKVRIVKAFRKSRSSCCNDGRPE